MSRAERGELFRKRCFWLRQLLHQRELDGGLSEALIKRYAKKMETSPRNLRRWVNRGNVPSGERKGVDPSDERIREALIASGGKVAPAAEVLRAERGRGYSERNLQRVIQEKMPADERAELLGGARKRRDAQLTFRLAVEEANDRWFVDHKESSVWVVHPATGEVVKAWLSSVVDGCSRALVACIATPGAPTKEDVLVLLFRAVSQTDRWPVGGVPHSIVWDNAGSFSADDITDALDKLKLDADPTDAYAPTQNGIAEAFNQTIDLRLSRAQLAYSHGAQRRNGTLYSGEEDALQWNVFLFKLDEFVNWYRHDHGHSEIGNRHTDAEWLRLTAEMSLPRYSPGDVEWLLPDRDEATVPASGGIHKWNNKYFSPDLILLPGRRVEFAYARWDIRTIEVIHDGHWVCTAKAGPPSAEEQKRHAGMLGARAADMSQRRERVNAQRREENDRLARDLPPAAAASTPEHTTPVVVPVVAGELAPAGPAELVAAELEDDLYDLGGLALAEDQEAS
ncbi:MAG: putative transposase [Solirubrobacteraceae bacterium]|jgi:transposase InsO family protein|nr:putative transposase [Solirubrobacteraceae bacterium]